MASRCTWSGAFIPEIESDVRWAGWYARGHATVRLCNTFVWCMWVVLLEAQRCGTNGMFFVFAGQFDGTDEIHGPSELCGVE